MGRTDASRRVDTRRYGAHAYHVRSGGNANVVPAAEDGKGIAKDMLRD